MPHKSHDVGVASQIGAYSDAIEVAQPARWLFTSGTPGLSSAGLLRDDVAGQAELAWRHIVAMLESADMSVHDLVKVTHYLIDAADIAPYVAVRARFLGKARPASMLLIVPQLVRPDFRVEVEAWAAKTLA